MNQGNSANGIGLGPGNSVPTHGGHMQLPSYGASGLDGQTSTPYQDPMQVRVASATGCPALLVNTRGVEVLLIRTFDSSRWIHSTHPCSYCRSVASSFNSHVQYLGSATLLPQQLCARQSGLKRCFDTCRLQSCKRCRHHRCSTR